VGGKQHRLACLLERSDYIPQSPPGLGIEFEQLDGPTRQRINELVRKLRAATPG